MSHPSALAHELNTRYLQPLLHVVLPRVERAQLDAFLRTWNVSLEELQVPTNWVSLRFCEALVEWMVQHVPAEELERETTRYIFQPSTMGFVYAVLRAVGSARQVYASLPRVSPVLNKVSRVTVEEVRHGYARLVYAPHKPEWAEQSPLICRIRKAQLVAGPTLWGLPTAQLTELRCQAKGDGECCYEVKWTERPGWWGVLLGLLVGGGALVFHPGLVAGISALVAATAVGRLWDQRRHLEDLKRFNEEQSHALHESVTATERRFLEVLEAKAQVDKKVEERTAELNQALRKLEELSAVKDEFLANVSHELRTPLTLILAPLEQVLGAPGLSAEMADNLRVMHRASMRLLGLVNDLVELARLQAGHLRLVVQETDVTALVQSAVEQFTPLAHRKGVTLQVQAPEAPVQAWVDEGRLGFVVDNLISNALKFTPAGGSITLAVTDDSAHVGLLVTDTGAGIPPEHLPHVFERFARYDNPAMPGASGAGIGLAMVRGVVELHGGTVGIVSTPGQGTTVSLQLPRDREHFPPEVLDRLCADVPVPWGRRGNPSVALLEPALATGGESQTLPPPGAPTVMVVEDHEDLRAFLVRTLSPHYRVTAAEDGARALLLMATDPPAAIISDVMMPNLDGHQLAARLKQDAVTRRIPIILITARKGTERMVQGLEVADDYLVKPFEARELLARLDVQLRMRRLMDEQVQAGKLVQLGMLAAGMAHEVNNPAGAMLAMLRKLRREMDGKVEARWLVPVDTSIQCAERISALVQDLLVLGQPDRDGPRAWDPHEGLRATLRVMEHRAGLGVKVECQFSFRGTVTVRPAAINQVFINLVDNALRAVGESGVITLSTRAQDGGVGIDVVDTGPGIATEHLERIFDPFFTTRGPGQGSGLGLHISRRIALDHGGRLEVSSTPGRGARFTLWLPGATAMDGAGGPA